jgi:hypothetical protein
MLALFHAAQAKIKKTATHGIALVSVTDAWMSGRGAYYVEMIAKHRLVAIHTAASSRLVAPPGGIRPGLGPTRFRLRLRRRACRSCSIYDSSCFRARRAAVRGAVQVVRPRPRSTTSPGTGAAAPMRICRSTAHKGRRRAPAAANQVSAPRQASERLGLCRVRLAQPRVGRCAARNGGERCR